MNIVALKETVGKMANRGRGPHIEFDSEVRRLAASCIDVCKFVPSSFVDSTNCSSRNLSHLSASSESSSWLAFRASVSIGYWISCDGTRICRDRCATCTSEAEPSREPSRNPWIHGLPRAVGLMVLISSLLESRSSIALSVDISDRQMSEKCQAKLFLGYLCTQATRFEECNFKLFPAGVSWVNEANNRISIEIGRAHV